jgi:hypothetical protein
MWQPTSCRWPPSLGECISCSNLYQFEPFLLHWMHHLKCYKIFLKCKDNRVASKDLKLQTGNWSYVPTHIMPMTPFTWRRCILLKPSSIWTIFVELDAPSKGLNYFFWTSKATDQCANIYKFLSLSYRHMYPSSCNLNVIKMFDPYFFVICFKFTNYISRCTNHFLKTNGTWDEPIKMVWPQKLNQK